MHQRQLLIDWQEMRNNMLYVIRIPAFRREKDVVLYEIVVRDLISGEVYENWLRFKVLKKMHDNLDSNIEFVPQFPKTHFWQRTNTDTSKIQSRRKDLQKYLNIVFNHPEIRGAKEVKKAMNLLKINRNRKRAHSQDKAVNRVAKRAQSVSTCSRSSIELDQQRIRFMEMHKSARK